LKGLLSEKADLEHIYTKDDIDGRSIDARFQTTDDNLLTFYGSQNTTLKTLLAEKMTIQDLQDAVTALDLPEKNNPEFTGVLKINNVDVESKIDSKLNATDPTIDATSDDLIMFTGVNNTSLKQLLQGKFNATALENTVINTNSLSDPVIVGSLNYKETSSDTDSRNLISEISNKANLSSPNFSTSLQLNSTNVLLQPGDFNGSLQAYIELKAPEQTPPDLSGLVSKPGDYNGDLQSYIELKAPAQAPPDLSGLVSKPGDYNGDLESYIVLKAPEQTPPDLSGFADRDEVQVLLTNYMPGWKIIKNYTTTAAINTLLGNYTNTVDLNSELGSYTNTTDLNERLYALEQRLSALEDTIESIMTSEPILSQINDTYTIEAVGDNLGSQGWYYKKMICSPSPLTLLLLYHSPEAKKV